MTPGTTLPKSTTQNRSDDSNTNSRERFTVSSVNHRKLSFRETSLTGNEAISDQHFRSLPSNISLENSDKTRNILQERHNIPSNSKTVKKYMPINTQESNISQSLNDDIDSKTINRNNSLKPADSLVMEQKNTSIGNGEYNRTKDLALCAILLDEWLKELAAISQEQSIVMIQTAKMH